MAELNSVTRPRDGSQPWQLADRRRDDLLTWFLGADLGTDAAVERLARLTGRVAVWALVDGVQWIFSRAPEANRFRRALGRRGESVRIADRGMLPPSPESGDFTIKGMTQQNDLASFYRAVQTQLRACVRLQAETLRKPTAAAKQRGEAFIYLEPFLQDVRVGVARDRLNRLRYPPAIAYRSDSLVGELGLALFYRMVDAKSSLHCPYCERVELFHDRYKRVTCGDGSCVAAYRRAWKREHPEPKRTVQARVRKLRTRRTAEKRSLAR